MLYLVLFGTIEGILALTAVEICLFLANLAFCCHFSHIITNYDCQPNSQLIQEFKSFSIMKLGCIKPRLNYYDKIDTNQKQRNHSRIEPARQISECVQQLSTHGINQLNRTKLLRQIITLSYSNWANQFYLCNNLRVPFRDGPVAITEIPASFAGKASQMFSLFKYLQRVKQSYICWLIFNDADLGVLNLKLITQFQLTQLDDQFSFGDSLVGLFVGKQYYSKVRTMSTKITYDKFHSSNLGLSTKTTKDSLHDKKNKLNKSLKSLSMKQKKNLKHDLSSKTLGQGITHHKRGGASETNLKSDSDSKFLYSQHKPKKSKAEYLNRTGG